MFHFLFGFLVVVIWLFFVFCFCCFWCLPCFALKNFVVVCRVYSREHHVIYLFCCCFGCLVLLFPCDPPFLFQSNPPFVSCVSVYVVCVSIILPLGAVSLVFGFSCTVHPAKITKLSLRFGGEISGKHCSAVAESV